MAKLLTRTLVNLPISFMSVNVGLSHVTKTQGNTKHNMHKCLYKKHCFDRFYGTIRGRSHCGCPAKIFRLQQTSLNVTVEPRGSLSSR